MLSAAKIIVRAPRPRSDDDGERRQRSDFREGSGSESGARPPRMGGGFGDRGGGGGDRGSFGGGDRGGGGGAGRPPFDSRGGPRPDFNRGGGGAPRVFTPGGPGGRPGGFTPRAPNINFGAKPDDLGLAVDSPGRRFSQPPAKMVVFFFSLRCQI